MPQSLYALHSATSGVYPTYGQLYGVGILCFGSTTETLIDGMEDVSNWAASSLTIADDSAIFRHGSKSMKITGFNAVTDYVQRDFVSKNWSAFTGFKLWCRCNHPSGLLRLQFIDGSGLSAMVDFPPILSWVKGDLAATACNEWVLKHFKLSDFVVASGFSWADVKYVRFTTREYTSTTQYNIDALWGVGAATLKIYPTGGDVVCDEMNLGRLDVTAANVTIADSTGAGALTAGTRHYKFCFVNKRMEPEQRGPLSASVSHTNAASKNNDISSIPNPGDSNITHIQIFRTNSSGSASVGPYYYLDEIAAGTTTYTDSTTDATLGGHEQLSDRYVQNSSEVPDSKYCLACADRMFYAGDPNYPNRVYWTELGTFAQFCADSYNDIGPDDGDEITGMFELNNTLYLTKNQTIWRVGNLYADPVQWDWDDLETGIGCVGHRTIQKIGVGVGNSPVACFLSDYPLNVYMFIPPGLCQPIGDKIMPQLTNTANHLRPNCPSAIDPERQRYILGLASASQTNCWDVAYAYDCRLSQKKGYPVWLPFDWGTFSALGNTSVGGMGILYDGTEVGYIFQWKDSTRNDATDTGNDANHLSGVVHSVTGTTFKIRCTGALNDCSADAFNGCRIYVTAGTGAGSWGTIRDTTPGGIATPLLGYYMDLVVTSWSGTTPIATDTVNIGPVGWYYKTKVFEFANVTKFVYLHLYFKSITNAVMTVDYYLDRSSTATGTVNVTIDKTYKRIGIPCWARQIQFRFACYRVGDSIELKEYRCSQSTRSEV